MKAIISFIARLLTRLLRHGPIYYFGYGSNMWLDQMRRRCPHHRVIGHATLPAYRWIISGEGGTKGYANVILSKGDRVEGTLFELSRWDEASLDVSEHVADGHYARRQLFVLCQHGGRKIVLALVYAADDSAEGRPVEEYVTRINNGVNDAGLSPAYVEKYIRPFVPAAR